MDEETTLKQKQKCYDRRVFIGLALTACFLTFLVCPFSPIYRYNFEPDEICYQIMSLGWIKGKIPYRDLFDHKGPLTYVIYALGLLLTGNDPIGIMFVFMAINAAIFIFIYRIQRLYFSTDRALGGTILLLVLFFVKKDPLYASGTKPDHFVLLCLLIAEYFYIRGIIQYGVEKHETTPNKHLSTRPVYNLTEMLIFGLCCGAVFMIKLNVCIYFFLFIGFYFLWLVIQKCWKSFFCSCGMFLLGIAIVSAPFFIYYYCHHAISDFFNAYFTFNTNYAKSGGIHFISRPFVDPENSMLVVILFLLLVIAGFVFMSAKKNRLTRSIILLSGMVTYAFIAFPEVFAYSFVLLIPLYLLACSVLIDLLFAFLSGKTMRLALGLLALVITVNFTLYQLVLLPSIPKEPSEFEQAMDEYYAQHPNSSTLYFWNLCQGKFFSSTLEVPNFKYFYMPRESGNDVTHEQVDYVRQGLPDVIAFLNTPDYEEETVELLDAFFEEYGYVQYYDDSSYIIYVRLSTLN